jgi:outer membrane protein assembly factor BamD (BamD/ComL family)
LAAAPSRAAQASPIRAARVAPASAGADPAIEPPAPDATLAEEVRWLDRASLSIRSGDVERGLQLLDEYKGRFPSGTMTPESQVLRIEALVRKGDRVNANRLGDEFLARAPQSALAARVRSLLLSKQKEQAP